MMSTLEVTEVKNLSILVIFHRFIVLSTGVEGQSPDKQQWEEETDKKTKKKSNGKLT